jgi:hypothetical protein
VRLILVFSSGRWPPKPLVDLKISISLLTRPRHQRIEQHGNDSFGSFESDPLKMTTSGKLRPVTPVSILAGEIESLSDELSGLSLPADAQRRLERIQQIAGGLDPYVQLCTTPHSDALASLVESTNAKDWGTLHGDGDTLHELESEMLSGHVEGQFLKFLIAISRASRVLEIGMFTGYATLAKSSPANWTRSRPNLRDRFLTPPNMVPKFTSEWDRLTASFSGLRNRIRSSI